MGVLAEKKEERIGGWVRKRVYCSPFSSCGSQDLGNLLFLALSSNASVAECVPLGDW